MNPLSSSSVPLSVSSSSLDEETAFALHQSYIEAQTRSYQALETQQQEEEALGRALRESQILHDTKVAQELQQQIQIENQTHQEDLQIHQQQQWEYYDHIIQEQTAEAYQGTWDCPNCSLCNPPYIAKKCQACHTSAPPHILCFTQLSSHASFGVELEIVIQNGVRDGFSYQTLADNLTKVAQASAGRKPSLQVRFCGYTHQTMTCWKIVTDASIKAGPHDLAMELVSPVLTGEEGLVVMRHMFQALRTLGITTNNSCGFHVHLDASGWGLPSLKRIGQCFCALEDAFDLLVARSWKATKNFHRTANRNRYCKSNRLAFGTMSNLQRWQRIDEARTIHYLVNTILNPNGDRYRKLNMSNIVRNDRPSTVEFRNHGRVEEILEGEAWVRLLQHFCSNAASRTATSTNCLLPSKDGNDIQLQLKRLFDVVACPGLEQYFCVERRLFDTRQDLSNIWTCWKCRRTFQSSRSLSQHRSAVDH